MPGEGDDKTGHHPRWALKNNFGKILTFIINLDI